MEATKNEGYELKKVIESPQAVVRVFSPIISDKERAKRMKEIHNAAARLLTATK